MIELKYVFVLNKYLCYNYYEYSKPALNFNSISTYTYLTSARWHFFWLNFLMELLNFKIWTWIFNPNRYFAIKKLQSYINLLRILYNFKWYITWWIAHLWYTIGIQEPLESHLGWRYFLWFVSYLRNSVGDIDRTILSRTLIVQVNKKYLKP